MLASPHLQYGITGVPAFKSFVNGKEIGSFTGNNAASLTAAVEKLKASA